MIKPEIGDIVRFNGPGTLLSIGQELIVSEIYKNTVVVKSETGLQYWLKIEDFNNGKLDIVGSDICDECRDQGYYFISSGGKKEKRQCICSED